MILTVSYLLFFLCSEEELPNHNAAAERVSPALHVFIIIGELCYQRIKISTLVTLNAVLCKWCGHLNLTQSVSLRK